MNELERQNDRNRGSKERDGVKGREMERKGETVIRWFTFLMPVASRVVPG